MNSKRRIVWTILTLLLAAAVSLSAAVGGEKDHWANLKKELNLTDAQVAQLQQKFEALRPQGEEMELKVRAVRSQIEEEEKATAPDRKAIEHKNAELAAAKREWKEKVTAIYRAVLTSEQFAKWQRMESDEKHEKARKEISEKKNKD